MDNNIDKKIIKSPYYSHEDLKNYSELLQRGLTDIKIPEQQETEEDSFIGSEFIGNDGKKYTVGETTIREIEIHTDVQ